MDFYLLGIAAIAVPALLTLIWQIIVRRRPTGLEPETTVGVEDTVILQSGQGPFAGVSQLLHSDEVLKISSIVAGTLAAQKAFVSIHSGDMPHKARDNFSIGYVGGYLTEVLRRKCLLTTQAAIAIELAVFDEIFGSTDGDNLHERYQALQKSADADLAAGMRAGASDIAEWLRNELNIPFGWSTYVYDSQDTV